MKRKRQFAKAVRRKANRGFRGYPVATVALYGPDDKHASKLAVGIVVDESDEVVDLRRWHSEAADLREDPEIEKELVEFIRVHGVQSVVMTDRIIGCPHEEAIDYPEGEVCPECPFWAHRDRWTGVVVH
ncbi:MAG: hypothetical protein ACE5GX_18450 [Thermoanaerobaculia bacterium]